MRDWLSVVGARPQFVKAAAIDRAIQAHGGIRHRLLHTGQHYDDAMSGVFFSELGIPRPQVDLGVGSGPHGSQTALMIAGIEQVLMEQRPELVVAYGDTNSTLAAAIAATKLGVPVAHVEAGLRSFNKGMPEEVNRILCDHCSTWLFCPTPAAVRNLAREGFGTAQIERATAQTPAIHLAGDVMQESSLHFAALAEQRSDVLRRSGLQPDRYMLATVHRDFNADDPERLVRILVALHASAAEHALPMILPLHPRTAAQVARLESDGRWARSSDGWLRLIDPVGYLDMIALERNTRLVLTDSGGVQKEAYFFQKPCVVLRPETEWVELVETGQARLVDADPVLLQEAVNDFLRNGAPHRPGLYGDGRAAARIVQALAR